MGASAGAIPSKLADKYTADEHANWASNDLHVRRSTSLTMSNSEKRHIIIMSNTTANTDQQQSYDDLIDIVYITELCHNSYSWNCMNFKCYFAVSFTCVYFIYLTLYFTITSCTECPDFSIPRLVLNGITKTQIPAYSLSFETHLWPHHYTIFLLARWFLPLDASCASVVLQVLILCARLWKPHILWQN